MADMTFGQMMLADILPPDIYQPGVAINKKRLNEMMGQVAQRYPDRYADIAHRLVRLGLKSGESMGGASFGLKDLATTPVVRARQEQIRNEMKELLDNTPEDQQQEAIVKLLRRHSKEMPELVYQDGVANKNRFTLQLEGAGRGNKKSLSSMMAGDILVENSVGEPIPVPISRGYGQGQTLGQYYATAYGARRGITQTKLCLAGDTLVKMADGSDCEIRRLRPGDMVLGADCCGQVRPVRVIELFDNGERECNRYVFNRQSAKKHTLSLVATEDHAILAARRVCGRSDATSLYRPTMRPLREGRIYQNVRKNTFVAIPCRGYEQSVAEFGCTEPLALLMGLMLGDGCMTKRSKGYHLSSADPQLIDDVAEYIALLGLQVSRYKSPNHSITIPSEDRRDLFKRASYQDAKGYRYRRRGSIHPVLRELDSRLGRSYAHEKVVPRGVWGWSQESICKLLAGLFSTDGCFHVVDGELIKFSLALTSRAMLESVSQLLIYRLGVWPSEISLAARAGEGNRKNDLWAFSVDRSLCLARLRDCVLSYLVGVKRQQFAKADIWVKYSEQFGKLLSLNKFGCKLISSEPVGLVRTYDIEVDHENHAFVLTGGLIVSNSVGSSGYLSKLLQQAGHRLVVVGDDDDKADPDEQRGLLVDAADPDNVGALLARDIGPYRRNTVITPSMLTALHRLGNGQVLIRSPIASSSLSGGLYARDVGVREFGRLARRGEHVGNPASQAIGEQVQQMSLCLAEGTLVRMADMTTKQIQDIVPGDRVLGADTNCNAFPVRVLNTFKNGDKEVYRTEFRYPYQTRPMLLESSLDHKILSSRFTTGQRSDVDNYIPTVSPVGRSGSKVYAHPVERIQCETSPGPGRDFAFLIGYLIGNGCYTEPVTRGGGGPMLSCASESTLICLREAAAKFGYSVNFHKGSQCYYRLVMDTQTIDKRDEATGRVLPGVRNIFKKWLRDRGMWCKYSYEKVLPEDVKRWDDDSLRGILQGLFASDGTAYELESAGYPHVGYGSTSRELVEQIMWLLQFRVGVYPGELATSRLGDRKHAMHSINISHLCLLRRFLDWIGTIPGDRGVRLHRSVSAAESLRRRGVGYYARRHSQNRVGVMSTYDLEVDHPDHLFVLANGLIVSNSAKHSGGAAGDEKTQPGLSGFALVERLANPPKEGRGLAIHAQHDGKVQDVRPAPQGGTYLTIGGKEHYVPADFTMTVRQGDVVEAGDELTDGVADPAEVVRLKGIGEGRRYFVNSMRRALQESGAPVDRRNLELLATGLINRVRIDRQFGEFMPGSLVSYGRVEKLYRPRKDSQRTALEGAAGRYLERPALHYSIGTRLTPKILDGLKRGGIKEVVSHTEVPPFTAVPVRAADALQSDPDFMTQFFGSHLQKNLLKSIQAGGESDENSTSFVPLRAGGVNLGRPGFLLSGS